MKIFNVVVDADMVKIFHDKTGIKSNVMISYTYLRGQAYKLTKEYREMIDFLFLDSTGFQAKTGRPAGTVSGYSLYINPYGHLYDGVFNLDDDFSDPEHNWRNQIYLEKHLPKGAKKPIPVLHADDLFGEFEQYYGDHGFVAIGSNKKPGDEFFRKIQEKYPDLKMHMFGTLNRELLLKHKPFSADSSAYAHTAGLGVILYWRPEENREYSIYLGERERDQSKGKKKGNQPIHFDEFKYREELETFLYSTFKYRRRDLLTSAVAKQIVNFYFFTQLEAYLTSLEK